MGFEMDVQTVIRKASVLIEALPYIQRFRGAVIVVKFGGSAMEVPEHMDSVLADVTFMECVGMRPVLVHGGGKAISRRLSEEGIDSRFYKGLRVTCGRSMRVVESVIGGEINPDIVNRLRARGARAVGVDGRRVLQVRAMRDADAGGEDRAWGFVGEPALVNTEPLEALLHRDAIPVLTPLGVDAEGASHNVNADVAAAAVAGALGARKLVFLSDVPGLLRDPKDEHSILSTLCVGDVPELIRSGIIAGGMLPKVRSGIEAMQAGVRKIHMVDGRLPHSLLLEIFTDEGVGTQIVAEANANGEESGGRKDDE